jgi:hypothetical protein
MPITNLQELTMRKYRHTPYSATLFLAALLSAPAAMAADVKITPLGSQQGEFCQLDRALILEDPDGTRSRSPERSYYHSINLG